MYEQSNQLIVKEPYLSSFFRVLTSTIVKDVKISFRYRANLIGGLIQVAVFVISFYLLSIAIDFRDSGAFVHNPGDQALFIFFLSGIIAMLFKKQHSTPHSTESIAICTTGHLSTSTVIPHTVMPTILEGSYLTSLSSRFLSSP